MEKLCHLVNRFMCLCIVALFKNESRYAESILQNNDLNRLFDQVTRDLRDISARTITPIGIERSIAQSLKQIAAQTQEIAESIVFWLQGTTLAEESGAAATL
jgi:hypothetical protein